MILSRSASKGFFTRWIVMLVKPWRVPGILQGAVDRLHKAISIFRRMRKKYMVGTAWQMVNFPITDHATGSFVQGD